MLFKHLFALTQKGVKLTITVESADDGKLEVCVLPESETGKSGISLVSKSFVATPEELDAEFPDVVASFAQTNSSLKDQLAQFEVQAAQVVKDAEAAAKAAKPAKAAPTTNTKPSQKGPLDVRGEMREDGDDDLPGTSPVAASTQTATEPEPFTL